VEGGPPGGDREDLPLRPAEGAAEESRCEVSAQCPVPAEPLIVLRWPCCRHCAHPAGLEFTGHSAPCYWCAIAPMRGTWLDPALPPEPDPRRRYVKAGGDRCHPADVPAAILAARRKA
jgi:hypothetical protein